MNPLVTLTSFAREQCIADPVLLVAIILGNLGIFAAYMWIPCCLLKILRLQSRMPEPALFLLAITFIASCGFTHFASVLVIFRSYYDLEAGVLLVTAGVSLATGAVLSRRVRAITQAVSEYYVLKKRVGELDSQLVAAPPVES